ncbi:hypothetical protein AGMMS50293_30680 [Spirochaetia bacterium]|nr:hypothetical protein AGMMS50293_30680 [Spirochaetia bacterium]
MKKMLPLLTLCLLLPLAQGCKTTGSAAGITLDQAIQIAADEINAGLAGGTSAAFINFASSSNRLSDYVIEELMGKLVNAKKLVVVDRSNLELIREEMDFQLSGEVSDESAQAIGKKLGAQAIVIGSLVDLGCDYRFRAYTLNVESAARQTATLLTIRRDRQLSFLLGDDVNARPGLAEGNVAPVAQGAAQTQGASAQQTAAVQPGRTPAREAAAGLVRIERGTFIMGSPASEPSHDRDELQHQVTVSAFYLGKYEVTQAEYEEIMGANPSHAKGANLPVEKVSWDDAIEYCNRRSEKEGFAPVYTRQGDAVIWNTRSAGYRLPTEAEWEYACRAGTTGPFNTGDNITVHEANYNGVPYNGNARGMNRHCTMPVGSFAPNPWGLYDMHGNVSEWVWDWYADYSPAAQTDPQGPSMGKWNQKVARGGSWTEPAGVNRSAVRFYGEAFFRSYDLGFRVARSINR